MEANYVTVFTLKEEEIFDGDKTTIASMMELIFPGLKDQQKGLWRVLIIL